MYFFAKKPTSIIPINSVKNPCPENFKFSGCGICLPEEFRRFRNINFALPIEHPRMTLSCGCFDCPKNTFHSGFNICIKNKIFEFGLDRKFHDCVTPNKPQQILETSSPEKRGNIQKYLLAAGTGILGFMFLFFLTSKE